MNAAINIQQRPGDPDITPHHVVKRILLERADRHRTRLPVQDSSPTHRAESDVSDLLNNEK